MQRLLIPLIISAVAFIGTIALTAAANDQGIFGSVDYGNDEYAVHVDQDGEIAGVAAKTTVEKDDVVLIEDSSASNAKKSVTLSNLMVVPHGGLAAENQSTNITLTLQSTYYLYDQFEFDDITATAIPASRTDPDASTDRITIQEAGTYYVFASIGAEGTAGQSFQWEIHKNGFRTQTISNRMTLVSETIQSVGIGGLLSLAVNDYIDLRVRCYTQAAVVARGRDATLTVLRVGP